MELLEHYSHEITTDPMDIYCCAGTGGAMGIYWSNETGAMGIYWSNGYLLEQWVSTGAMGIYWSNGYLLEQWVSTGAMGIYLSAGTMGTYSPLLTDQRIIYPQTL